MKKKETPWERRNLGEESSVEYYVFSDDNVNELQEIWDSKYHYQVLHIEAGKVDALLAAQDKGFHLLEMNIRLIRSLSEDIILPKIYQRYNETLRFRYAKSEEIGEILKIVKSGEMFLTDKVAMDPLLGKKKSGERYSYWAEDMIKNGAITVVTTYKNMLIGFEIYHEDNGQCENFIGGVFPEYANKGLGFAPLYCELINQRDRGNKKVITGVSSNNIPVLKVHEMLGFKVEKMSYSLVRHVLR